MFIIRTKYFIFYIKVITMMKVKNYGLSVEINHNPNWAYVPDHPYRISIIGGYLSKSK